MKQAGADLRCRWCKRPVRFEGNPALPDEERPAVHADTGLETGDDGHVAAPIDPDIISWDMAALS